MSAGGGQPAGKGRRAPTGTQINVDFFVSFFYSKCANASCPVCPFWRLFFPCVIALAPCPFVGLVARVPFLFEKKKDEKKINKKGKKEEATHAQANSLFSSSFALLGAKALLAGRHTRSTAARHLGRHAQTPTPHRPWRHKQKRQTSFSKKKRKKRAPLQRRPQ
ncbi:hypothetical protein TW95_gp1238 [Pandoravirus inopinatum]|uniref:Transmembrane protein n=1 Tax=Pandoravirus inopinatum TaxID=1605721 RepID=A0A0B5JDY6_9VIRU|nr:hypothetical protein TW95_gp1238 [Pandoravirus inopinatum]AJF97972.1 hypothetical protein [Pandoravirus inopinatum]